MAMTTCKECGNPVSSEAWDCPSCGVSLRKPKRGFFGGLIKLTFILFNLAMLFWLLSYYADVGTQMQGYTSEAERNGAAIGLTIGTGVILQYWMAGGVVLGLLVLMTRPRRK